DSDLVLLPPPACELCRREVAERLVRAVRVVVLPPVVDQDLGFQYRVDHLAVEQLATLLVVVGLDVGILPRGARLDEQGPRSSPDAPTPERLGDELWAIVTPDVLGGSALRDDPLEHRHHLLGGDRS